MAAPRALFFDLDDTLIDDEASAARSFARVLEVVRPSLPRLDDAVAAAAYLEASNSTWNSGVVNASNVQEMRLGFWRAALTTAGCDDDSLCLLARDTYLAFRGEGTVLHDDAVATLQALKGRYRLAVLSNGMLPMQQRKLEDTGLAPFFELIVTSDHFERGKPDTAMFRHALAAMSLEPDDAWHIGDGILTDVPGARAAGLRAVWLNRRGDTLEAHHTAPHHEIASLTELLPLLSR